MLEGDIHPNTTLFDLPRLQRLNLASNHLNGSKFLQEIGRFPTSLTHLNISQCSFTGEISFKISVYPKLVSLDLSRNDIQMQPYVLNSLLQNSSYLRELVIDGTNLSGVLPTSLNISSPLKTLNQASTNLQGKLPNNIFNLPYLEQLDLGYNFDLTGSFPEVNKSTSSFRLKWLDLYGTNLIGEIPESIGYLKSLYYLQLASTKLSGEIPKSIGHLKSLNHMDLSSTKLFGAIPESIGHLKSLNHMDLSGCQLIGSIPKSLINLRNLTTLRLSSNMLNGTLPSFFFTLPLLQVVYLDGNMFSGGLPSEFFHCASLKELSLKDNRFDGKIHQGSTPPSHIQPMNLTLLDLSYNNFSDIWELDILLSNLPNLIQLDLSYSGLSIMTNNITSNINPSLWNLTLRSGNLTMFPESLRAMKHLGILDLSNNNIHGDIPDWVGNGLIYLNLSYNSITSLPHFQWDGLSELYLQSNQIKGSFPPSICNISNLLYLDMSNNHFDGVIPKCVESMWSLELIDLRNNHFHGTIPNMCNNYYEELMALLLNGNQLEGEVPTSLSKCEFLQVLDLGNNRLSGTFPHFLGDLWNLKVLILKSNNFHGPINASSTTKFPFPLLQVLDISNNKFEGHLPPKFFVNLNAMKAVVRRGPQQEYFELPYSIILGVKGQEVPYLYIFVLFMIVDLSNNTFVGDFPNTVGTLNGLIVLNLSHNNLTGHIPPALRNLSNIESLDLSWNQLTGDIPESLVDLKFLSFLNLSQNRLMGRIPQGKQFNTFSANSYKGNLKLCGFPLPNSCEHRSSPQPVEADGDEEENFFTWKVVMLGYGCGSLIGLAMGYLMLSTGRPKWFNEIANKEERMIHRGQKKRRYL